MKADLSRNTFRKGAHHRDVITQQGRVAVDADPNEQQAINVHRAETTATDVIGECGVPLHGGGFEITANDGKLKISAGRLYVDGILCENEQEVEYAAQPDLPNAAAIGELLTNAKLETGLVYLDVWLRHLTALDDPLMREKALGGPDTATRAKVVWQVKVLPVAGRGVQVDARALPALLAQMREALAFADEFRATLTAAGIAIPPALDEAEQIAKHLVTSDTQDEVVAGLRTLLSKLKEIPLPAADRPNPLPREVRERFIRFLADSDAALNPEGTSQNANCGTPFPEWLALTNPGTGTLIARTQAAPLSENLCSLPPSAGYQRLENQLYRVEIHRGNRGTDAATATFKWSRDNGSVVTAIEDVNALEIVVQSVGPDEVLGFAAGQWVEISDDLDDLNGLPGDLIQIDTVSAATRTLTMKTMPPSVDMARHPKLRRWDQTGAGATDAGVKIATPPAWQELEGGVEVLLAGKHKTGDYWLIPARTATGKIEWTFQPEAQPPRGIRHHFCRLALVQLVDGELKTIADCRKKFPPLTELSAGAEPGIRVTELRLNTGEPLLNDTDVPVDRFARGLEILCDAKVDTRSVRGRPVCFVALEMPFPFNDVDRRIWGGDVVGFQPLVLAADIGSKGSVITWTPARTTQQWLQNTLFQQMREFGRGTSVLARLTLQGNFIWNDANPELFLDGEVFGITDAAAGNTRLRLPSGDRRRGGKLEMWFRLVPPPPPPPALIELSLAPDTVRAPAPFSGTVTLDGDAPEGGAVIELSSRRVRGDAVAVTIPPNVLVQRGARSAVFTGEVGATRSGATFEITASFNGNSIGRPLSIIGVPA